MSIKALLDKAAENIDTPRGRLVVGATVGVPISIAGVVSGNIITTITGIVVFLGVVTANWWGATGKQELDARRVELAVGRLAKAEAKLRQPDRRQRRLENKAAAAQAALDRLKTTRNDTQGQ